MYRYSHWSDANVTILHYDCDNILGQWIPNVWVAHDNNFEFEQDRIRDIQLEYQRAGEKYREQEMQMKPKKKCFFKFFCNKLKV